ncbi:hypothetical protein PSET11_03239 [Arthrobacter ulcerisalmonis]|uniref:Uncharacterized protein n=1 Tax=Arthrobacter ulcerisalmonis TaxID=2483813 RepID=A0A3P5XVK6_9MICC|nr:hypothetical protein PSET11_03239 [Arthrobacter ulcerisalmonis]
MSVIPGRAKKSFTTSKPAIRSPATAASRDAASGQYVTVVLKSRGGKTVTVSPAAAKVLKQTEELRERVSRDW